MDTTRRLVFGFSLATLLAIPGLAGQPGHATGTVTLDGKVSTLAFATSGTTENLFDETREDTIVVLSDRELGEIPPADMIELQMGARKGALVALALRLDGAKLVNVAVHAAGLDGVSLLPGAWFTYEPGAGGTGSLSLTRRESDGHAYACAVEFTAAPARVPGPSPTTTVEATPEPTPTLPPASTSSIDPKAMAAMLVAAMMSKDEEQALTLVKSGADPNLRDQYGVPMLNWATMMCMPRLVKALVDRGADLTYERAPGLTILQEAGACPEAAKILRAAGAR